MNIEEDLRICESIMKSYRSLTTEDGESAYKISQLSLGMYDRLNEIRLQVNKVDIRGEYTKSDLKEYIRSKMKMMEYIHVESRSIFNTVNNDYRKMKRG